MQGDARRLIVAMQAARPPFVVHGLSVFPYLCKISFLFHLSASSLEGVFFCRFLCCGLLSAGGVSAACTAAGGLRQRH